MALAMRVRSLLGVAGALAAGAFATFFLDPEQGRRRRAIARDKLVSGLKHASGSSQALAQRVRNRSTGAVHSFTPRKTELAEGEVRRQWEAAGQPRIDGPVSLQVTLVLERPRGHFRADGETLSSEGERNPYPARQKPDVDNALKLVMDALNTRAWPDDVRVVNASVERVWGPRAQTLIHVKEAYA